MLFQSQYQFPQPSVADPDGHGFVGIGGDLQPSTLLHAYSMGLFPWFSEGEPVAWWSPEPRCVVYSQSFQPNKSLKKSIRKNNYWLTVNLAFEEVISTCADIRMDTDGTWITDDMISAYVELHEMGYAHSIEIWSTDPLQTLNHIDKEPAQLIGGVYGLKIGTGFFGESMFHKRTDTSKMAFTFLARLAAQSGIEVIDCQLENPHLMSLGANLITRDTFLNKLTTMISEPSKDWQFFSQDAVSFPISTLLDPDYIYI